MLLPWYEWLFFAYSIWFSHNAGFSHPVSSYIIFSIKHLIWPLLSLWLITQLAIIIAVQFAPRDIAQAPESDVAFVLGNAVHKKGMPNPCLRSRVAVAVALYHEGKVRTLLMSGGTDSDGSNEARSMAAIAQSLGVPSENILLEPASESTFENFKFSAPMLRDYPRVTVVSSDFHLLRARWLAHFMLPQQQVNTLAGERCDMSTRTYVWKLGRESLAWGKTLLLDKWWQAPL